MSAITNRVYSSGSLIRSFSTCNRNHPSSLIAIRRAPHFSPVNSTFSLSKKKTTTTSTPRSAARITFHLSLSQTRAQSTTSKMPSSLKVGDTIPSGTFSYIPYTPELSSPTVCGNAIDLKTDAWKGKKIVLFGVPGAFTKSCSTNHLPGYIKKAGEVKAKGIDGIYCIASNDAFVMSGWGRLLGSHEHVEMISDSSLKWLEQAGLTVDLSSHGLGKRGTRFALVLDDLKVTYVGVEESAGSVTVSSVDAVLPKL
ncbi:hypothetical protein PCANC_10450 [Puccinia coronata f. sp. avenae]|uniref:Putative peroxiredoxin n=1 Tax=Puccinia coronata f. sp. avenae TaxID=200324 RepID=A0A2N5VIB6_9BASI|nr:hypothetical protein PCASD_22988 [Puccinia coronata f. sp. avenae]PLW49731.1 hypothetical protein PCANC_10450 [Puccinia coronata f. sp. avenae]